MLRLFPFLLLGFLIGACPAPNETDDDDDSAGTDVQDDDDVSAEPTWTAVQASLASRCGPCHTTNIRAGLTDLNDYDAAYDNLVGQPADQVPSLNRVEAGDPDSSYLLHKVRGTHEEVGGDGDPMPPGSRAPLSGDQVQALEDWILDGAAKD